MSLTHCILLFKRMIKFFLQMIVIIIILHNVQFILTRYVTPIHLKDHVSFDASTIYWILPVLQCAMRRQALLSHYQVHQQLLRYPILAFLVLSYKQKSYKGVPHYCVMWSTSKISLLYLHCTVIAITPVKVTICDENQINFNSNLKYF